MLKKFGFLLIIFFVIIIFSLLLFYKNEDYTLKLKETVATVKVNQNIEIPFDWSKSFNYKKIKYDNYDNDIIEIIDNKYIKGKSVGSTVIFITLDKKTVNLYVKVIDEININDEIIDNEANINIESNEKKNIIPMSDYIFPEIVDDVEKKVLNVLIVDIDPILTKGKINGKSCAGITASECLGQNKKQVIDELIIDLEESSHGIIDVQVVKTEKLNEFSTHKSQIKLLNGDSSNRLDESTWLDIMKNGWYDSLRDERIKQLGTYTYDYNYLINKLNLVDRKNNNEFHEVWLVNVDPTKTFESLMVGRNPYWINGTPITKNCDNFRIMNVSISRPDVNIECNGHVAEDVLDNVFGTSVSYNENVLSINNSNYTNLNLWQKFTLSEHHNSFKNTGLSGVGDIHFSPNSIKDYDWENYNNIVNSKWREWLDYPNITDNPSQESFSPNVYMNKKINGTKSAARLHHRWWFSLMPHVTGYTKDGYSNNWWDYLYLGNFVTNVSFDNNNYIYNVGDYVDDISVNLIYKNLEKEIFVINSYENNIIFSNTSIFNIDEDGKIISSKKGNSILTYYRDGKSSSVNIEIK